MTPWIRWYIQFTKVPLNSFVWLYNLRQWFKHFYSRKTYRKYQKYTVFLKIDKIFHIFDWIWRFLDQVQSLNLNFSRKLYRWKIPAEILVAVGNLNLNLLFSRFSTWKRLTIIIFKFFSICFWKCFKIIMYCLIYIYLIKL